MCPLSSNPNQSIPKQSHGQQLLSSLVFLGKLWLMVACRIWHKNPFPAGAQVQVGSEQGSIFWKFIPQKQLVGKGSARSAICSTAPLKIPFSAPPGGVSVLRGDTAQPNLSSATAESL